MATYFDATEPADLALLPEALRDHTDLANVAARVEAEVIAWFTVSTYRGTDVDTAAWTLDPAAVEVADFHYVCLRGYAVDSDDADEELFEALRQEVARVLAHRLFQTKREPGLRFAIEGNLQKQYRADAEDLWPKPFPFRLRLYDVRPVNHIV
jgi:hypothetical protein